MGLPEQPYLNLKVIEVRITPERRKKTKGLRLPIQETDGPLCRRVILEYIFVWSTCGKTRFVPSHVQRLACCSVGPRGSKGKKDLFQICWQAGRQAGIVRQTVGNAEHQSSSAVDSHMLAAICLLRSLTLLPQPQPKA